MIKKLESSLFSPQLAHSLRFGQSPPSCSSSRSHLHTHSRHRLGLHPGLASLTSFQQRQALANLLFSPSVKTPTSVIFFLPRQQQSIAAVTTSVAISKGTTNAVVRFFVGFQFPVLLPFQILFDTLLGFSFLCLLFQRRHRHFDNPLSLSYSLVYKLSQNRSSTLSLYHRFPTEWFHFHSSLVHFQVVVPLSSWYKSLWLRGRCRNA